jgi:DNA-binding transcriptional regulator GbsR (MarR family)
MPESPLEQSKALFIRRWGEMATMWGISRTMAEIHALLFVSSQPLCTDDVMDQLQVSRGSASTNLRDLTRWGLIQRIHQRGDRKEYFKAESDVWQMFEIIFRERRRREVEPIAETLKRCHDMTDADAKHLKGQAREDLLDYRKKLEAMSEFLDVMNTLFNLFVTTGRQGVKQLVQFAGKYEVKKITESFSNNPAASIEMRPKRKSAGGGSLT